MWNRSWLWIKHFCEFIRSIVFWLSKTEHPLLPNTQHSLDKLESLLKDLGYRIRYEKGNFKTGACMLQNSKVVVVNRFSNLEVKIGSLVNILQDMQTDSSALSEKQKQFLRSIKQTKLTI